MSRPVSRCSADSELEGSGYDTPALRADLPELTGDPGGLKGRSHRHSVRPVPAPAPQGHWLPGQRVSARQPDQARQDGEGREGHLLPGVRTAQQDSAGVQVRVLSSKQP